MGQKRSPLNFKKKHAFRIAQVPRYTKVLNNIFIPSLKKRVKSDSGMIETSVIKLPTRA